MPNPAAVAYEAYRRFLYEHNLIDTPLLEWDQTTPKYKEAWWNVVHSLIGQKISENQIKKEIEKEQGL